MINIITLIVQGMWALNENNTIRSLAGYKGCFILDLNTNVTYKVDMVEDVTTCTRCHGTGEDPHTDSFSYCRAAGCDLGETTRTHVVLVEATAYMLANAEEQAHYDTMHRVDVPTTRRLAF